MVKFDSVKLCDLFPGGEDRRIIGNSEIEVCSICYCSNECTTNSLFFCVPGFKHDGHDYAKDAISRGAVALCVERVLDLPITQVVVPSVRHIMGPVARRFFNKPSSNLLTVGITGTNGKTTVAFLTAFILSELGLRSGLMGTIKRRVGGNDMPAGRTTPEALDIQRDLAEMVEANDKAAVLEVSSHALDLGRVRGVDFSVVAFTNLTQDHLDFHGDLESYFKAKQRLFVDKELKNSSRWAVINIDDPYGRRLLLDLDRRSTLTFSMNSETTADLEISEYRIGPTCTEGVLVMRGNALIASANAKEFNAANNTNEHCEKHLPET